MSRKYYYFVASLPSLTYDGDPPISTRKFLSECARLTAPEDYRDIQLALAERKILEEIHNPLLRKWANFNRVFKNEIAWFRAVEANKDPLNYIRGDRYIEPYLVDVVVNASKAQNPLKAERMLDRARWDRLNALEQGHFFDLEYLIIYALKLKILERYKEINSPKGEQIFEGYKDMKIPQHELV